MSTTSETKSPKKSSSSTVSDSSSSGDSIRYGSINLEGAAVQPVESCGLQEPKRQTQQPSDENSITESIDNAAARWCVLVPPSQNSQPYVCSEVVRPKLQPQQPMASDDASGGTSDASTVSEVANEVAGSYVLIPPYLQQSVRSILLIESYKYEGGGNKAKDVVPQQGGSSLVQGSFTFSLRSLTPNVNFSVTGFTTVTERQNPATVPETVQEHASKELLLQEPEVGEARMSNVSAGAAEPGDRDNSEGSGAGDDDPVDDDPDVLSDNLLFPEDDNVPPTTKERDEVTEIGGNLPKRLPISGLHDIVKSSSNTEEPFVPAMPKPSQHPPLQTTSHDLVPRPSPSPQPTSTGFSEHHGTIIALQMRHIYRKEMINSVRDHKERKYKVLKTVVVSNELELNPTVYPYGLGIDKAAAITLHIRMHNPPKCKHPTSDKKYRLLITVTNDDETKTVLPLAPLYFTNSPEVFQVRLIPYLSLLQSKSAKINLTFQVESINKAERYIPPPLSSAIPIENKSHSRQEHASKEFLLQEPKVDEARMSNVSASAPGPGDHDNSEGGGAGDDDPDVMSDNLLFPKDDNVPPTTKEKDEVAEIGGNLPKKLPIGASHGYHKVDMSDVESPQSPELNNIPPPEQQLLSADTSAISNPSILTDGGATLQVNSEPRPSTDIDMVLQQSDMFPMESNVEFEHNQRESLTHTKRPNHGTESSSITGTGSEGATAVPEDTIPGSFLLQSLPLDPTHSVTGFTLATSKRDDRNNSETAGAANPGGTGDDDRDVMSDNLLFPKDDNVLPTTKEKDKVPEIGGNLPKKLPIGESSSITGTGSEGATAVPKDTIPGSFLLQSLPLDPTHSVTGFTLATSKRDDRNNSESAGAAKPGGTGDDDRDVMSDNLLFPKDDNVLPTTKEKDKVPEIGGNLPKKLPIGVDLPELKVVYEIKFKVTNESAKIDCEKYGIRLYIPTNSLPESCHCCYIKMRVIVSGSFQFPEKSTLVSALYCLSTDLEENFAKPLTLEIQHCACETSYGNLAIVKASGFTTCPYKFEFLEGGVFTESSSYGSIGVQHFCIFGVVDTVCSFFGINFLFKYCAFLYYMKKSDKKYVLYVIITKDSNIHTEAAKQQLIKDEKLEESDIIKQCKTRVDFDETADEKKICLDFTKTTCQDKWEISAPFPPVIMKSDVNRFRPYETGIHICQLKIEWVGKDEPVASTRIVNLDGANRYDYFEVECGVEGAEEQTSRELCKFDPTRDQSALQFWELHFHDLGQTLNGENIVIAMLDSGIQTSNEMLTSNWDSNGPKILLDISQNFCDNEDNIMDIEDRNGHGTRCAGIAAGLPFFGNASAIGPGVFHFLGGVAPRSNLIICKVSKDRSPTPTAVYKALEYLNSLQESGRCRKIHAVCMCLGFRNVEIPESDAHKIQDQINLLAIRDTVCVVSAGNDAQRYTTQVLFPASCENTIAVGSHDTRGVLSTLFSPKENVFCLTLGENIIAPTIGASNKELCVCAGTSMAAAAVTGLVALLIQSQIRNGRSYSFNQVKRVLEGMRNGLVLRPRRFLLTASKDGDYFKESER